VEGYKLDIDADERLAQEQAGGTPSHVGGAGPVAAGTMAVNVNVAHTQVLLRNTLRTPVLELEARDMRLQWSQEVGRAWPLAPGPGPGS
jgi:hypothetical protein